ncbi:MAG: carboxylating nicotinate-nucleotide diphosphorylase [bacterium]
MSCREGHDHQAAEAALERIVRAALEEDIGAGDITTRAVIEGDPEARGRIVFREAGVLAGTEAMMKVFQIVDVDIEVKLLSKDGDECPSDTVIAEVVGPAAGMLSAERTALNFLQHLSGVATFTRRFVEAVAGTGAEILDTRKTMPGMRLLEKQAVAAGGGRNHRMGLYDEILIKDNHIALAGGAHGGVGEAVRRAREKAAGKRIEVEVATLEEVGAAVRAGADIIMLDNMGLELLKKAIEVIGGKAKVEVSGGVTLGNVREIAELGVDYISVGALTHSAPALDIAMEMEG